MLYGAEEDNLVRVVEAVEVGIQAYCSPKDFSLAGMNRGKDPLDLLSCSSVPPFWPPPLT